MNHNEYNGWWNYETWVCALWLQNDQGSCTYWEEMTNEVESIYDLSNLIKDEIEEGDPTNDQASLYSDLMSDAISEINFNEIAKHFWDDYRSVEKVNDIVSSMIDVYNNNKDDPIWLSDDYIRVFYDQTWIPNLFDQIDEQLQVHDLWLETEEGDPTDVYVCGNIEGDE